MHPWLREARRMLRLIERVVWRVQSPFSVLMPFFFIALRIPICRCESPSVTRVCTPIADSSSSINFLPKSFPSSSSALPMAWSGGNSFGSLLYVASESSPLGSCTPCFSSGRLWGYVLVQAQPRSKAPRSVYLVD